jgi:hypothetical protein
MRNKQAITVSLKSRTGGYFHNHGSATCGKTGYGQAVCKGRTLTVNDGQRSMISSQWLRNLSSTQLIERLNRTLNF